MLRKKLRSMIGTAVLGAIGTLASGAALAEDWPVGISCEIRDVENGTKTEFTKTAYGPWVFVDRILERSNSRHALRVEGSNQHSWGVIYLKNAENNQYRIKYGQVSTHEKFSLEFDGWKVECAQWPYIAG